MASFASPLQPLSNGATSIAADEELLYTLDDLRITAAPQEGDNTPWGAGQWGRVPSFPGDVLFADFIGQQHVMRESADKGWPTLVSTRCADFENVTVTMIL